MSKKIFLFHKKDSEKDTLFGFLKSQLALKKVFIPDGFLRKYIEEGFVLLNDRNQTNINLPVRENASAAIAIKLKDLNKFIKPPQAQFHFNSTNILFEDEDLIIVNKPFGLPTHSTIDPDQDHLVAAIKRFIKDRDGASPYLGIHQRLDKDTSGVILFTKNLDVNKNTGKLFENRVVKKYYLVLTQSKNHIPEKFKIQNYLTRSKKDKKKMISVKDGGDLAITHFKILRKINNYFVIEAKPETGRTHQIRTHLAEKGLPILGDPIYGPKDSSQNYPRLFLHAHSLEFPHPRTQQKISIKAPIPEEYFDIVGKF